MSTGTRNLKKQVTKNLKIKMMKKLTFLTLMAVTALFFASCEEDEDTSKVDFNVVVTGESPNAIVQITNTSDSADVFTWGFSEGANITTTTETNPQVIVDKTGDFKITLIATTGEKEEKKSKTVKITGKNGISFFENLEFGRSGYTNTYGEYFSCSSGLVYTENELTNSIKSIIDFVIYARGGIVIYGPDECDDPIVGYRTTDFNNNIDNSFTIEDFNNLQDDENLKNLSNADNYYVVVYFEEPPRVILMKDYEGKWGAIKLKEVQTEKIIVDVKMQKYLSE
ncbi:MAG: hypothetical protein A2X13_10760 [Bacteroidetes bacterium GWC2_33_15]|nr:MAG: hypothetical protein A2X10_03310 [Bacteroidetes bacterium GWA2_33_15]OFX48875.1 MAG: hypothetical protein A2X13_10760 [Bacteroidetes bacterium GWC2_33_15]OFX66118.1 MAG: hypothetical protein A2X15_11905 [Bacteroidetes bacterium GWB2_32_14]HAN17888.1 hypothetical protein [Bacteroidales bacterium]